MNKGVVLIPFTAIIGSLVLFAVAGQTGTPPPPRPTSLVNNGVAAINARAQGSYQAQIDCAADPTCLR